MAEAGTISEFMAATLAKLVARDPTTPDYPVTPEDLAHRTNCPVCGSTRCSQISEVYLDRRLRFFATAACDDCLFVYRNVFPSFRWFKARWKQIASGRLEVFNADLEAVRGSRYREYAAHVSRFRRGGRLLEIGAGFGTGASVFRDADFHVEALEPEDDRITYIRDVLGIRCHGVTLEEFTAPPKSYDVIVCAHNLEHVDDPSQQATRLRDWLTDDGIIYCEVPVVWNIVDFADSLFLTHKSNFAESNFAHLMRRVGLDCLETHYPRLNTPHANDLGVLMRPAAGPPRGWDVMTRKDDGRSVADIRAAYRRLAPVKLPERDVIRLSVPRVTHFFYTIRGNSGRFVDRRAQTGFVEFEEATGGD